MADGSWSSEYKVGDKFVCVYCEDHHIFIDGEIVEFILNDGSKNPRFKGNDNQEAFCSWVRLSKYKSEESMNKFMNTFKKEDLKTGMRVTCRSGEVYVVCLNTSEGDIFCMFDGGFNRVSSYDDNWLLKTCNEKYDIVKIESPLHVADNMVKHPKLTLLWERKEISPLQKDFDDLQSQIQALQEKANTIQQQINN